MQIRFRRHSPDRRFRPGDPRRGPDPSGARQPGCRQGVSRSGAQAQPFRRRQRVGGRNLPRWRRRAAAAGGWHRNRCEGGRSLREAAGPRSRGCLFPARAMRLIDLTGSTMMPMRRRACLRGGAPQLALRPLSDAPEGQAEANPDQRDRDRCGAGPRSGIPAAMPAGRWRVADPGTGHRARHIIYPDTFVERVPESIKGVGLEFEVLDRAAIAKLGMGACSASPGFGT